MSATGVLQNSRREHKMKLCNKGDAPAEKHGNWRKASVSSKNTDKATLYSFTEAGAMLTLSSKNPEEREFVVDSEASTHMLSKKYLSSAELETLRKSRNPTTVVTANGKAQTNEEAQENVYDFDLFVTVQSLEYALAVLSLGKFCEEHGNTHEWPSGQKPHSHQRRKEDPTQDEQFRTYGCPGIVVKFRRQLVFYIATAGLYKSSRSAK